MHHPFPATGTDSRYSPEQLVELVSTMVSAVERTDDGGILMATLPPIVQLGHPVLRMDAAEYSGQLTPALLEDLLLVMRATMHAAPGVGLAAPQLGIPLRIAVLEDRHPVAEDAAAAREREPLGYFAAINPQYRAVGGRPAAFYEGCLSFAGYQGVVERPADIAANYATPAGDHVNREFHGWQARIFQHETDHLDGTVYIDKALTRSLVSNAEYLRRWAGADIAEARAGLRF